MSPKRVAIIGAGPIGLEAALYGARLGHDVHVYERGVIGHNMRNWGHVRLFSSWSINHSMLGVSLLRKAGLTFPAPDEYLTGLEHVEWYLSPLVRSAPLEGRVHEGTKVISVGRDGIGKRDLIGGPRQEHPFRLLLHGPRGEELVEADVVIDASGTYGNPNWIGSGNIPALGERVLRHRIAYTLEDVAGSDRRRYNGKRVLLVGSGHSAATALEGLTQLAKTKVVWISRDRRSQPLSIIPNDPLPERVRLSEMANGLAAGGNTAVEYRPNTEVERLAERGDGFEVTLRSGKQQETLIVDRILAHVGYRPNNQIYSELQVHECYASLGPMKLSAALLGEGGASADCLAETSKGADVLRNPEPNFFIVGAKSYGKNSNFLIRIGIQQVREVFSLLEGKPDLDLYAA